MKNRSTVQKDRKYDSIKYLGYEDYAEMFQEGMSDSEISHELGINEKYIKRLRSEYQSDY